MHRRVNACIYFFITLAYFIIQNLTLPWITGNVIVAVKPQYRSFAVYTEALLCSIYHCCSGPPTERGCGAKPGLRRMATLIILPGHGVVKTETVPELKSRLPFASSD